MARRGRKMNLKNPRGLEARVMQAQGVRLTDREPLLGYMVAQYTRHSNRPNCKCNTKGQSHGPYYYRIWVDRIGSRYEHYMPRGQEREIIARVRQWRVDNSRHRDVRTLLSVLGGYHLLSRMGSGDFKRKSNAQRLRQTT